MAERSDARKARVDRQRLLNQREGIPLPDEHIDMDSTRVPPEVIEWLTELAARTAGAKARIDRLRKSEPNEVSQTRLNGKYEGIALVESYIYEAIAEAKKS